MGYSKIDNSLTDLLKKEWKWEWDAECQATFQKLKDVVRPEKFQFLKKWQNRNFGYKIVISVKNP